MRSAPPPEAARRPRRILFVHPHGPGQFVHLAPHLAVRHGHEVAFLSRETEVSLPGVRGLRCRPHRAPGRATHPYAAWTEQAALAGQAVLRACQALSRSGFVPDLVIAHPGWGDALFLREAFPRARILAYCEYFWRAEGADLGFADPTEAGLDARCTLRLRNAPLLASLEAADALVAPTCWQRDLHPDWLRPRIAVVHDGIDIARIRPDGAASFAVRGGPVLWAADEVATFVARGLEPQRGFPSLMRALPALLAARPNLHVVVAGADAPAYGPAPRSAATWREALLAEIGPLPPRVHFVGTLAYGDYLTLLQVSRLHLHLSVPFVLSWSLTEAMAACCLLLAADTAPVREFITDGANGYLVDPRDPAAIAARAAALLADPAVHAPLRAAARRTIEARCALADCLAAQAAMVDALLDDGGNEAARFVRQSGAAMP